MGCPLFMTAETTQLSLCSLTAQRDCMYLVVPNVWEWVTDWYAPYFFAEGQVLRNTFGPRRGQMKVRRGGSWPDSIISMRTGYRDWSYPFSRSFNDIGFRCVVNLKAYGQSN